MTIHVCPDLTWTCLFWSTCPLVQPLWLSPPFVPLLLLFISLTCLTCVSLCPCPLVYIRQAFLLCAASLVALMSSFHLSYSFCFDCCSCFIGLNKGTECCPPPRVWLQHGVHPWTGMTAVVTWCYPACAWPLKSLHTRIKLNTVCGVWRSIAAGLRVLIREKEGNPIRHQI